MKTLRSIAGVMLPSGGAFPEGGADENLPEDLKKLSESVKFSLLPVRIFLFFFNLLPLLLFFSFRTFNMMNDSRREEFVKKLEGSRFLGLNMIFMLLKVLCMPILYSSSRISERIGYKQECAGRG